MNLDEEDYGNIADTVRGDCPLYQDDGEICVEEYLEGDACSRNCRYMDKALEYMLQPARQREEVFHGLA